MVQFNLLPDIKIEYLKAQRAKRSVVLISAIVSGAAITIFVLLFILVNYTQKTHINNLTKDIEAKKSELSSIEDLDKILTVQSQLNSLGGLHSDKPVAARFYAYLPQLVPEGVTLSNVTVNFSESTISLTGSTSSMVKVNEFVDTLKFANFVIKPLDGEDDQAQVDETSQQKAFTEVKSSSEIDSNSSVRYQVNLVFDPRLFESSHSVELIVPEKETTRSIIEKPSTELFKPQETQDSEGVRP